MTLFKVGYSSSESPNKPSSHLLLPELTGGEFFDPGASSFSSSSSSLAPKSLGPMSPYGGLTAINMGADSLLNMVLGTAADLKASDVKPTPKCVWIAKSMDTKIINTNIIGSDLYRLICFVCSDSIYSG
mmetsp:Transcript_28962/g.29307  ORF Transcript_28962/g.29307 Transcript_28962/m.29307 type:complete len:129 (-) Transcript_28962:42-428(-)